MILILIYSFLIVIATSYTFPKFTIINNKYFSLLFIIILSILSMYVIYITDINYTDRSTYTRIFNTSKSLNLGDHLTSTGHEPLYIIFNNLISYFFDEVIIFYLLLHLLFLVVLVAGLFKINGTYYIGYTLFIMINAFFYYSYTLNGLRQGISMALIVLVIGYLLSNNKIKAIITSIISILFHYSSIPMILLMFFLRYYRKYLKLNYLIAFYFLVSILFIFDLQQIFVGSLGISYIEQYSNEGLIDHYGETNNINFLIFNSFFLILFYYFYSKYYKNDKTYKYLFKIYILFSTFFLLFGFVAFSNRIAAYSWFLIPLLIGYYLNNSTNTIFKILIIIVILFLGIVSGIPERFIH